MYKAIDPTVPTEPHLAYRRSMTSSRALVGLLGEIAALERHFEADPDSAWFQCPIPGHDHEAWLEIPPDDPVEELRLRCQADDRWRSLGEVAASVAYGRDRTGRPHRAGGLSNREIVVWTRRLLHDAGVPLPLVSLRPPSGLTTTAWPVFEGFALLFGIREMTDPGEPIPYTVRFAVAWCGTSVRRAAHGINELIGAGVLQHTGSYGTGPWETPLYRPASTCLDDPPPLAEEDATCKPANGIPRPTSAGSTPPTTAAERSSSQLATRMPEMPTTFGNAPGDPAVGELSGQLVLGI